MAKRILLVGHCGPDSSYLRMAVQLAEPEAEILAADDENELVHVLRNGVDLLLVNRVLDGGFAQSGGVELMARLKAVFPSLKWLLISNHADAQAAARAAGAVPGFGKRNIGSAVATMAIKAALR
jgi:DNA-binding NarL/FixJ family response regulator